MDRNQLAQRGAGLPGTASEAPLANQVIPMTGYTLKSLYDLRTRLREANTAVGCPARDSEGRKELNEKTPESLLEINAASLAILRDCHEELSQLFNALGI